MLALHAQEKCITGAKARGGFRKSRNLLIYVRWRFEGAFFRSRCQRGTAVFAVVCPFCGTQEKCGARQNLDDARRWMARGFTEFPAREIPEEVSGSRVRRIYLSSLRVGIHDLICNTHRVRCRYCLRLGLRTARWLRVLTKASGSNNASEPEAR